MKKMILIFFVLATGCMNDGGRKGRPLIHKFGENESEVVTRLCTEAYHLFEQSCLTSNLCPTGTHIGTADEITTAKNDLDVNGNFTPDERQLIKDNMDSATQVCLEGSGVLRPDRDFSVKNDFCICSKGEAENQNMCENFCLNKTHSASKLYGSVTVGPNIILNPVLGDLGNWCLTEIPGSDYTSPNCTIEFNDGTTTTSVNLNVSKGSNSFNADVTSTTVLNYKTPYIATIVESASGSNAKSVSFQIYRIKPTDSKPEIPVPLKIMAVSQYTCLNKSYSTDAYNPNIFYWEFAARLHFYYANNNSPPAMPPFTPGNYYYLCHDANEHGFNDNPLYDRLENVPQHFSMWDVSDLHFADTDGDQKIDIHKFLEDKLLEDYNEVRTIGDLFSLFSARNYPLASSSQSVGYIMQPWIDQNGYAFCPSQAEYNGSDNLLKLFKEIIGVNTEGLFVAEREPVTLTDQQGNNIAAPSDYIFIGETLLKKIWFYKENNQYFVPDKITSGSRTVRFFWPPDTSAPLVKKETSQRTYTIRRLNELGNTNPIPLSGPITHDKRIGCMPSMNP